jgi:hypothetical protein
MGRGRYIHRIFWNNTHDFLVKVIQKVAGNAGNIVFSTPSSARREAEFVGGSFVMRHIDCFLP